MMLGLAIGDALGNSSEFEDPSKRRTRVGEIRDYLPNRYVAEARKATPSDDSQMAFLTLECMTEHRGYQPDAVAQVLGRQPLTGAGTVVRDFAASIRDGVSWIAAGSASAGNGALMRIVPVVIPHLRQPGTTLWADAALLTMTTHNDPAAIATSLAFAELLWELLAAGDVPPAEWWPRQFMRTLEELETGRVYEARGGWYKGNRGPFSELVKTRLDHAVRRRWSVSDACEAFYSGAYLLETVPCVLWILMQCAHDPEEAIVRAVNDTYDNDTIGAIVGAAAGALHGASALPSRWREGLTGRIGAKDDGRMFEILEAAERQFAVKSVD